MICQARREAIDATPRLRNAFRAQRCRVLAGGSFAPPRRPPALRDRRGARRLADRRRLGVGQRRGA
jgi:hypothetical protein